MSTFTYEKIGQYGDEVKDYIIAKDGILKAKNGKDYRIRIDSKSYFARKNGFKDKIEKRQYVELNQELRKTQFEIAEWPVDAISADGRLKDLKYKTLGWTQLEKKVFSSKNITIDTPQQEKISLKIFEYVLGSRTQNWRSFDEMFRAGEDRNGKAVSGVAKIFPELNKLPDWWAHFTLQFNEIKEATDLPNNKFDVYQYDGKGSFMKYISDLVVKEMSLYSQKDSWNPADIWLIQTEKIKQHYIKEFNGISKKLQDGKMNGNQAIQEINKKLKEAFAENYIVGISLKKSDGRNLRYEKFNMQANINDSRDLPNVNFDKIQLDCSYDKETGTFKSKTSYAFVKDGQEGAFKLAYKSNTGAVVGNITYEFLPAGPASAFLGKVPKDRIKDFLAENIGLVLSTQPIPFPARSKKSSKLFGNPFVTEMAQSVLLPVTMPKETMKMYEEKVKVIKRAFGGGASKLIDIDSFAENLSHSYTHANSDGEAGLSVKNSSMMQMVEFTYQMAQMKQKKSESAGDMLQEFLTKAYYFAQKRGQIYNFGPFGKLY